MAGIWLALPRGEAELYWSSPLPLCLCAVSLTRQVRGPPSAPSGPRVRGSGGDGTPGPKGLRGLACRRWVNVRGGAQRARESRSARKALKGSVAWVRASPEPTCRLTRRGGAFAPTAICRRPAGLGWGRGPRSPPRGAPPLPRRDSRRPRPLSAHPADPGRLGHNHTAMTRKFSESEPADLRPLKSVPLLFII